ncbi:MAG: diaminopimelate epimerase [Rhizomicrobium sp.]
MAAFLKMHGLGNDFAVFDARRQTLTLTPAIARALGSRKRGIGCDQIIVIAPGRDGADATMRIVNADGSEVETCGNAARCVARLLLAETGKREVTLATLGGLLRCSDAGAGLISVDMGIAHTVWDKIPLAEEVDTNRFVLDVAGDKWEAAAVSMGNPHCVLFVDDAEAADVAAIGARIETHALFPRRTNVEFVSLIGPDHLRMRVWERGAGITEACGSGACATAFAAFRRGLTGAAVRVQLDGGELELSVTDGHVIMTGPATQVFAGDISLNGLTA